MTILDKTKAFAALHVKSDPVILYNIWDPGSARAVAAAGAKAIATGSAPVAMAHGFADGQKIPRAMMLDNLRRIVEAVDLPVTADIEGGYGVAPAEVAETAAETIRAGAVGFNVEDQIVGGEGLYEIADQAARILAIREAVDAVTSDVFINARTDIFLKTKPDTHTEAKLDDALARAEAYAAAGASGFFAPGLADEAMIGRLCADCSLPVNIIALPHVPGPARLAELGASRISYGPVPYKQMVNWLEQQARAAIGYRNA
ncbi:MULTISPECIES: isocitrate lyase/phosphoenolpyruvate mutase family protein [unclassified Roseovarius]|uniref:isocitrate lyase/PEP mutase family protein n=1 Tax=unclassified Roseovarius TaxID=2614913 RepID=UPI00273F92D4|nr:MULTISPECIES: isocitrate lyase/phosphoenolpyruvate mutase family protein [unclassified Roseovarius]